MGFPSVHRLTWGAQRCQQEVNFHTTPTTKAVIKQAPSQWPGWPVLRMDQLLFDKTKQKLDTAYQGITQRVGAQGFM